MRILNCDMLRSNFTLASIHSAELSSFLEIREKKNPGGTDGQMGTVGNAMWSPRTAS